MVYDLRLKYTQPAHSKNVGLFYPENESQTTKGPDLSFLTWLWTGSPVCFVNISKKILNAKLVPVGVVKFGSKPLYGSLNFLFLFQECLKYPIYSKRYANTTVVNTTHGNAA